MSNFLVRLTCFCLLLLARSQHPPKTVHGSTSYDRLSHFLPTMAAAGPRYVACPWCKKDDLLQGRSLSAHLRSCTKQPQPLWNRLPVGRESNKRARSEAEDNPTINQVQRQLNADIHAAHDDGFSGDMHRIGALPPLVDLASHGKGYYGDEKLRTNAEKGKYFCVLPRRKWSQ